MTIKEKISDLMKSSMKSGDKETLLFVRNLHSAVRKKEIDDRADLGARRLEKAVVHVEGGDVLVFRRTSRIQENEFRRDRSRTRVIEIREVDVDARVLVDVDADEAGRVSEARKPQENREQEGGDGADRAETKDEIHEVPPYME